MIDGAKLCYLATVYSKHPKGLEAAFVEASKLAAKLIRATVKVTYVYSPICHSHSIAMHGNLDPLDYSLWLPFNEKMLALSDVLIVARMDGWDTSVGIAEEVKFFEAAGKPIYDLYPETMLMARRIDHALQRARIGIAELDAKIAAHPHWDAVEWHEERKSLQRFVQSRELKSSVTDERLIGRARVLKPNLNLANEKSRSEQGGASA